MTKEQAFRNARIILRNYLTKCYENTGDATFFATGMDITKNNIVEHLDAYINMLNELKSILESSDNND